jgi:hypothetical protein
LYVLERESLAEVRNATVHAFLASVLTETPGGYRLYWAVSVHPVSRLTPLSMALIEPFHRCLVYPAIFRRIRRAWEECYTRSLDPPASGTVSRIRIAVTRSGHCNPGFKEAPHASEGVFSGIGSRPGVYRASHTMRRHRHVGVIGGVRKRFDACVGGGALAIRGSCTV